VQVELVITLTLAAEVAEAEVIELARQLLNFYFLLALLIQLPLEQAVQDDLMVQVLHFLQLLPQVEVVAECV
jgi:hypothetical protein